MGSNTRAAATHPANYPPYEHFSEESDVSLFFGCSYVIKCVNKSNCISSSYHVEALLTYARSPSILLPLTDESPFIALGNVEACCRCDAYNHRMSRGILVVGTPKARTIVPNYRPIAIAGSPNQWTFQPRPYRTAALRGRKCSYGGSGRSRSAPFVPSRLEASIVTANVSPLNSEKRVMDQRKKLTGHTRMYHASL
jgi:hypothetical protein